MKIDSKILLEAIKKATQTVGSELVQLVLRKGKLRISAVGDRIFETALALEGQDPREDFEFALPHALLTKNLKGVVTITCDRQVVISTATYKAELAYQPYLDPEFEKRTESTEVTPEQIYQIESSLSYLSLTGVVEAVHYAVVIDKDGFRACAFDRVHFAHYKNPSVKREKPLSMMVHINDMTMLLSAMQSDEEGFTMSVHDGYVQANNSTSRLRMPLLQVNSQQGIEQVEGLLANLAPPSIKLIPADLYDALDRARVIAEVTGAVYLKGEPNKLFVQTSSATGKFDEVIAAQTKKGDKIDQPTDPALLLDVLGRLYKDEDCLMGHSDRFTSFVTKGDGCTVVYACFCKQVQ